MRAIRYGVLLLVFAACGGRQVEVQNAPRPAAEVFLSVTNRLVQSVNVYVVRGSTEGFLRQVAANSTELLPVPDMVPGTAVLLRARTADGTRTFTRSDVVLRGTVAWAIP
jgi:hypothetical protein